MTTSTQLQLRRGTGGQCDGLTPAIGEAVYDSTFKRLRIGDGAQAGGLPVPNYKDLQTQYFNVASVVGGTGNATTLTFPKDTASDAANTLIQWFVTNANSGATAVAVDGRGSVTVKKIKSGSLSDLETGDLVVGQFARAISNGTYYILQLTDLGNAAAPGMVFLAAITGGGSTYSFTNYITSTYSTYLLVFRALLPATNSVDLYLRLRRSGQGSYDAGSTDYFYSGNTNTGSANTPYGAGSGGTAIKIAPGVGSSAVSGQGASGEIFIHKSHTDARGGIRWSGSFFNAAGNPTDFCGSGHRDTAVDMDSAQLLYSSGNISQGDAFFYGLKSS